MIIEIWFMEQDNKQRVKLLREFAKAHRVDDLQALKRIVEVYAMNQHLNKMDNTNIKIF